MKKYYYSDGSEKFGPFTLEELRQQNIKDDSLVWYEGLQDWMPANQLPELNSLLQSSPFSGELSQTNPVPEPPANRPPMPKNWLVESILATIFCCLPFGIVGIINAAKVESKYNSGDFEGAETASKEAGKWTKISFWLGIVVAVLYVIYMVVVIGMSSGGFDF